VIPPTQSFLKDYRKNLMAEGNGLMKMQFRKKEEED